MVEWVLVAGARCGMMMDRQLGRDCAEHSKNNEASFEKPLSLLPGCKTITTAVVNHMEFCSGMSIIDVHCGRSGIPTQCFF